MTNPPQPADPRRAAAARPALPSVSSDQLLQGATTLEIGHAGQRYLLRVTRENKLILTK
jgi:hemin uptake protein HemP